MGLPALILQNFRKHISLSDDEQELLWGKFRSLELKKKEMLLRAGEICRYESFVMRGCLRAYFIDERGTEHTVMFAPEDWWVGDLYSFLTGTESELIIEALEDSALLQISKADLEEMYLKIPALERFFRIMLQNAFVAQQQRILGSLSMTAEERYEAFLRKYPQLEQRLTQKQIASYLGITPEFLSMIRSRSAR